MKKNPLIRLRELGQSIWLDFLRRGMIESGGLKKLIEEDGVSGVTSNPSIFEKAIAGSRDYDSAIRSLSMQGRSAEEIYRALVIEDIQRAADLLIPVFERSRGEDGFVSLEVSPHLAHDKDGTVAEARSLWALVGRRNVMIKVPATVEGLGAIRRLVSEGVNVNITLLFGLPRYREVAESYLSGLEDRAAPGDPVDDVFSVASFFLSRIDVLLDPMLEKLAANGGDAPRIARKLIGGMAVASAKVAAQICKEIFGSSRFAALAAKGGRPQRLLWASTSAKNPAYPDTKYVEPIIGAGTITTLPIETLNAYRDHGDSALRLDEGIEDASGMFHELAVLGIDIDAVTQKLEDEGIRKFISPYDALMKTIKDRREAALSEPIDMQSFSLGIAEKAVNRRISALQKDGCVERLWRKDGRLWKEDKVAQRQIRDALGWLHVPEKMEGHIGVIREFVNEVKNSGFRHVVHMGMGGSSLAPLVFERSCGAPDEGLPLTVLDTTDPGTILMIERKIPLSQTLFIVASKSGTTAEPLAFADYFYSRVERIKGKKAGENFVAITDPGTELVRRAGEQHYRRVFLNFPDIGGRYSALSYFGLLPAALMGVDIEELVLRSLRMLHACAPCVAPCDNPGLALGAAIGELARRGRDKLTLLIPEAISSFALWLEQLIAESTGKEEVGIVPVVGEPLLDASRYGSDRVFVSIDLDGAGDESIEHLVLRLKEAGKPVISVKIKDLLDLGQEFFRWEMATAVSGAVLRINPFDQPNVAESKSNTNRLLEVARDKGRIPEGDPSFEEGPLRVYARKAAGTLAGTAEKFLRSAHTGDYVALLAYITESPETGKALASIRGTLTRKTGLATTLGYGPRFLHSTGQLHKGGPNTGLFIQLTADEERDIKIPGRRYTFGTFKMAQALGDLEALRKHRRRAIRVHLTGDVARALTALSGIIDKIPAIPVK